MKFPSLYYSNKTKTHWMVHEQQGENVLISEQITGGSQFLAPKDKIQAKIDSGDLIYREGLSLLMQDHRMKLEMEKGKRKRK